MRAVLILLSIALSSSLVVAANVAATLVADGFDFPVGKPNASGYYRSRGYRANGHLGDDWNGKGGGDTDLGDPVYSVANGLVVFAQDFGHGWGNVVIVRHVFEEEGRPRFVDSLYGHLDRILVRHGQQMRRGQQLGTIGTGGGLYPAHLHFEMRKDIRVGMARHRFPQDDTIYWSPADFINAHRRLKSSSSVAAVPMDTFVAFDGVAPESPGVVSGLRVPILPNGSPMAPGQKGNWKPDRFEDLRKPGLPR
jgi:murein DD-endopeptidase MepM/ murein hydrolase activator NlpD